MFRRRQVLARLLAGFDFRHQIQMPFGAGAGHVHQSHLLKGLALGLRLGQVGVNRVGAGGGGAQGADQ